MLPHEHRCIHGTGEGGIVVAGTDGLTDLIYGSTAGDNLSGLSGDDFIFGDGGADTINGGGGDEDLEPKGARE